MRKTLLPLLCCPDCRAPLSFEPFGAPDGSGAIQSGAFVCTSCKNFFPLIESVPRFLPNALSSHSDFLDKYQNEISAFAKKTGAKLEIGTLSKLKKDTMRNFGSEWETWGQFGWGDGQTKESARRMFDYKVLFKEDEIKGKRVLDAGCGNGRYSKIALDYGAEVVGVDLSHAVDVTQKNLGGNEKMHIVQADLFKLPFKEKVFDFIFSNGVLMHTGDAKRAFLSIVPLLTDMGKITVHLYHKGNFIYEIVDGSLRAITTRLPLSVMYQLSKIGAWMASLIPRSFLDRVINYFVRFEPHPHYIFDWYTAPIATHHTYKEVYGWLTETNLHLHHDHNASAYPFIRKWVAPFLFMTVKAGRQPALEIKHTRT